MLVSKTLGQKKGNNLENKKIAACHLNEVIKTGFYGYKKRLNGSNRWCQSTGRSRVLPLQVLVHIMPRAFTSSNYIFKTP